MACKYNTHGVGPTWTIQRDQADLSRATLEAHCGPQFEKNRLQGTHLSVDNADSSVPHVRVVGTHAFASELEQREVALSLVPLPQILQHNTPMYQLTYHRH
jgi:hypothetical protein